MQNKNATNKKGQHDSPCYSPCAASLTGIPPGGLGLSGLIHEKAHRNISKSI